MYKLAYTRFLGATFALFLFSMSMSGVVGVSILGYWALVKGVDVPILLVLGFLGMAATSLLLWLPLDVNIVPGKWGQRWRQLMQGWQVLSQSPLLLAQLIGLDLLKTLSFAGRYWVAFHILSQDVTLAQCLLFSAATTLTTLVNITPGALGVREGIVAGVAAMLGFEAEISVVAVGIDRLVSTLVVIVTGVIYTYVLGKQVIKAQPESMPATAVAQEHSNLD
jgi:uncharacterized membrane protein YbhN (UPF0104 family)